MFSFWKKNILDRDVKDLLNPPPCELFGEFLKKGVEYSYVFIDIESLFVMSFLMPFFGPVPRLNTMALCLYIPSTARTMEPSGPRKAKPVPITVMHVVMATSGLTDLQLSRRLLKAHGWWSRKVTIFCFKTFSGHDSPMFWSFLRNVSSKACPKCSKQDLLPATSAQRSKPCCQGCQSNILIDLDLYSACSAWLK